MSWKEKGKNTMVGILTKRANPILIHDEARVESTKERREADDDNQNLEEKGENAFILARNNMHVAVDPTTRLPEPQPEWVSPLSKLDKGEPMFSDIDNPGN
jgi:hypothetical protein